MCTSTYIVQYLLGNPYNPYISDHSGVKSQRQQASIMSARNPSVVQNANDRSYWIFQTFLVGAVKGL